MGLDGWDVDRRNLDLRHRRRLGGKRPGAGWWVLRWARRWVRAPGCSTGAAAPPTSGRAGTKARSGPEPGMPEGETDGGWTRRGSRGAGRPGVAARCRRRRRGRGRVFADVHDCRRVFGRAARRAFVRERPVDSNGAADTDADHGHGRRSCLRGQASERGLDPGAELVHQRPETGGGAARHRQSERERAARAGKEGVSRRRAEIELARDLVGREAAPLAEQERVPLPLGQRLERFRQLGEEVT